MTHKVSFGRILMIFFMSALALISIFPFYSMIIMGTYQANELFTGIKVLPGNFLEENIATLFTIDILRYYRNTFVVALSVSVLTVLICSLAGFGFAKYKFKMKSTLFNFILLTMMVPMQLGLVAFIVQMRVINWLDTLFPLILPPAASAFGTFWMTQFSGKAIPDEIMESGRIDGCGEFRIFAQLALPFMMPACMTLALFSFLLSWNSFLLPLVVISDHELFTLPLGIRQLATQFRFDGAAQILGLTVATIPVLVFFSAFSKSLITGLSAAAIKG